jgi:hypothetical protein
MRVIKAYWHGLVGALLVSPALAWGPQGHQMVGAITDTLIAGTHAATEVKNILGAEKLRTASLWADCAKAVTRDAAGAFHYVVNARFPECAPFQTAAGKRSMVDFVKRNWDACHPAADQEDCHRQYHYADVAIERNGYARSEVGTSDHDIVSAVNATITVLQGGTAAAPFDLASKKVALRALAHYIGDLHQPLHVGAIYLDAMGHEVDPDTTGLDPASKTQGGNKLMDGSHKLHGEWDDIPPSLTIANFRAAAVAAAKRVPAPAGAISDWAGQWASDSVVASHTAFQGLTFGAENTGPHTWPVTEPANYGAVRERLQRDQLVNAGAHFAQLLKAIFP